jgi:hypothetical protein
VLILKRGRSPFSRRPAEAARSLAARPAGEKKVGSTFLITVLGVFAKRRLAKAALR